ncbi:MAG: ExeM/NucH family extracellular endonuclease [Acidimicrobiia bacterium]
MTRRSSISLLVLSLILALVPTSALAAGDGITINEIRIDQGGADNDEYFELSGPAGASLDGYTYLVIGDGTGGSGVIEAVVLLTGHSIAADGLFVAAESTFTLATADLTATLNFENSDNLTHMLVTGFTGANGNDLDTDDDGALDLEPWAAAVDRIALILQDNPPTTTEFHYGPPTVGPDGAFVPGHAYDCGDPQDWQVGGFTLGTNDSPGEANDCSDAAPVALFIHQIQGDGATTPLPGVKVIVEGVVVGDFQGDPSFAGDQLGGFFVQEEPADWDDNADPVVGPSTSEGIFVSDPDAPEVGVGDVVRVTGTAVESFGRTQVTDVTEVAVTGSAPEAVVAPSVSLPVGDLSDFEPYEGMLVTFPQDLYISEFFNFDRFNEIVLTDGRHYQGTHSAEPGDPANAVTVANTLARITLDDGRGSSNPDPAIHPNGEEFTLVNTFRGGDVLQDVTGIMDFAFGLYRIQPVHLDDELEDLEAQPVVSYVVENPRPTTPDPIQGDIRVATFNVLNFFTHLDDGVNDICGPTQNLECRGADTAEEYQRQLDKLVVGIIALDADIVGIQEIENDIHDVVADGTRGHDPVLTLVEELNEVEGAEVWAWVGETAHYNDYPVRNEIIYRISAVEPVGVPTALADDAFDHVLDDNIEPVGRPPLAQVFRQIVNGGSRQPFAVVVNHFKSKGSSCGAGDPDLGDGQASCNLTRVAQSEALLDFVDELAEDSSGVLVIGDLNSYAMEDPIETLEAGGLTELVKRFVGPGAYTFVFDGQLGYLDTALATRSMLNRVKGVTVFHINADEPDILDYDMSFKKLAQVDLYEPLPYRVSDHDPVIIGISFGGPES